MLANFKNQNNLLFYIAFKLKSQIPLVLFSFKIHYLLA
ncbi:hypothetical protein PULV_a1017 [Pseudoalteromonas ulvae UL12]|nr:hypothetical protein [Pseudoalteromonas ulvae UL12]